MEPSPQTQDGPSAADTPNHDGAPEQKTGSTLRLDVLVSTTLLAVVLAVFAQVLGNDFVQWDDDIMVYQNPHIQGLDLERLRWMFTDVAYAMRYKPLTWLVYAVIHSLWGLSPFAFHFLGLLFHGANTVLLYWLLRKLASGSSASSWRVRLAAGLSALIWALHPLRVEPVARATDLTYGQTLFFCLISLLCYLRAAELGPDDRGRLRWRVAALLGYAIAMLSYPFVAGYAVILLILDVWPLRRLRPGRFLDPATRWVWLEKVPYLLLAGFAFMTWWGRSHPTGMWTLQESRELGLIAKAMQASYVWIYYLWRPWWPFNLSPIYTTLVDFLPASWPSLTSAILVVGLSALLVWGRKRWPLLLVLWCCHLILLVPALGLTESPHYPCDRYHHIPAILGSVLVLFGMIRLGSKAFVGALAGLVTLSALLAALTMVQVTVWRDSESLLKHMIATLGSDPYRAIIHRRLGRVYAESNRLDQAVEQYRLSLAISPGSGARQLLAEALERQGQWEAALVQYRDELERNPEDARTHGRMGYLLARMRRSGEAVSKLRAAVRLQPDSISDLNMLAWILATDGDASVRNALAAVPLAERACALTDHGRADVCLTLGTALLNTGNLAKAEQEAEHANRLAKGGNDGVLQAKCEELRSLVAQAKAAQESGGLRKP